MNCDFLQTPRDSQKDFLLLIILIFQQHWAFVSPPLKRKLHFVQMKNELEPTTN